MRAKRKQATLPNKADWMRGLSYAQRQRLRFFEARLLWEGLVNRQDVCHHFGVTANHFTREVSDYRNHYPSNVQYDVSARAYRPTERFQAGFATGGAEEYLALLRLYSHNPSQALLAEMGTSVSCEILPEPQGQMDREVLRAILRAIHGHRGCEIRYQSFSSPSTAKRIIWPHALVWAGERWHVRAFDERRMSYIDFVLVRISSVTAVNRAFPNEAGEDIDWHQSEILEIIPNPTLSESQKRVVALEYGMKKRASGYCWSVQLRRCLIPYFLFRYRLSNEPRSVDRNGFMLQRIVLSDASLVERYAFPVD